jgi:hypothetical protein
MTSFLKGKHGAFLAAALLGGLANLYGQEPQLDPGSLSVINSPVVVHNGTSDAQRINFVNPPVLQTFPYQFTSPRDGNVYSGTLVGGNPFNRGARTTTIPTVLIPLRVQFTGTVRNFDPTSADNGCLGVGNTAMSLVQGSPVFTPTNFTINGVNVGNTTFPDAFQRASFWTAVSGGSPAYHLALNVSVAAKQTISVVNGSVNGATFSVSGSCSTNTTAVDNPPRLGLVDINFLDPILNTIITNLGLTDNQFPFFVIYGVVISDGPANTTANCCILGYHSGSGVPATPGRTYGIGEYDQSYIFGGTKDISPISHEVQEWVDDPSGNNPVPAWGGIGQVSGCQNNLEVGDPMSGTLMPAIVMPNGKTYHLQEQAFFSWFMGTPVTGAGGKYSSNSTFGGFAKPCPTGGTF